MVRPAVPRAGGEDSTGFCGRQGNFLDSTRVLRWVFSGFVDRYIADAAAMMALGEEIAAGLTGGEVLALVGGLGAGKTHLTKGLASGLGCGAEATSPTFALLHEYPGGRLRLAHLDFYRIETAEELLAIGWDELLDEGGVVVAEWADCFPEIMPAETRWLRIEPTADGGRRVTG